MVGIPGTWPALLHLGDLKKLRRLSLNRTKVDHRVLEYLRHSDSLESLQLTDCKDISGNVGDALATLDSLSQLHLGGTSADDELSPAPIGISPLTIMSKPCSRRSRN